MTQLQPAITVLCGFLGAGKTTLLRHLLGQTEGERWALVVNDVGAINLDGRLVAEEAAAQAKARGDEGPEVVELGNGCVCCAIKDDLAETLCRLAAEGRFSHIIVESTGVAEPQGIARLFIQKNLFGRSITDFARLQALVTVVDGADFWRRWHEPPSAQNAVQPDVPRKLLELLIEQVECADLIILNKCDLVSEERLAELEGLIHGLNARAVLVRSEQGQVSRELVLDLCRFDPRDTLGAARWIQELNTAAASTLPGLADQASSPRGPTASKVEPEYTKKYGLRSFVFQARQPFAEAKLRALLAQGLPGIVRAKGFFWIRERPDEIAFLSLAGGIFREDWLNYWWAALIENGKAHLDERPPLIRSLWQEPHGDRRQELVFIGIGYDEPALRRALEACFA